MASNFEIAVVRNSNVSVLKLEGDFDATSAYELIYAIKKLPEETARIEIHTSGLKSVHPFGVEVFHRFMRSLNGHSARIAFTGNRVSQLSFGQVLATA
jgi:anti-anti-sigma regulatory factor